MYDAATLKTMVESFANRYRSMLHEAVKSGTVKRNLEEANRMLSGNVMSPEALEVFFNKTGFTKKEAGNMAITVAANRKLWERDAIEAKRTQVDSMSNSADDMAIKPMEELKKPSRRIRFKAVFGSKTAREIIRKYNKRFGKRAEKVRMTFRDLDEKERVSANKYQKKDQKGMERKIRDHESLKEYPMRTPGK